MKQVECLLHIISTCRQGDWVAYLAALDDQIQYLFAHDLYDYARLMPVHLAQMNQLKKMTQHWANNQKGTEGGQLLCKKT